jgi:hypothetical protein
MSAEIAATPESSTIPAGPVAAPPEGREDIEPSLAEVLTSLGAADVPPAERRRLILAAEVLRFDTAGAESLKPLLRQYIDLHCASEQREEQVAVASAVRKYVALLRVEELPAVADLLRAERKAPPSFEMEVAKMVARKLTATLPDDTVLLHPLGDELMDLAATYTTPRLLPKRYCGAVALDATLSLALLRSPHLPSLTNRLRSIPLHWFRETVARQARALRAELAGRFAAERCGSACACLADLAAAAQDSMP